MENKKYTYKGEIYSDDKTDKSLPNYGGDLWDLVDRLAEDDKNHAEFEKEEVVVYRINGEVFGTEDNTSYAEVIDELIYNGSFSDDGLDELK